MATKGTKDRGRDLPSGCEDVSPGPHRKSSTSYTLLWALRFMEGKESGSSLTPMQLLGTDIHAYAPHPTSHSSLPCTNTQNLLLKISCLSAEQLLGLTQDGLKKCEGIHSSKQTCRMGNCPVLVPCTADGSYAATLHGQHTIQSYEKIHCLWSYIYTPATSF